MQAQYIRGFDNFIGEAVSMEVPNALRELTVTRMGKLIEDTGDDFGIISASLPHDKPEDTIERLDQIEKELLKKKCSYIEITGGYNYPDKKKGGQNTEGFRVEQRLLFISGITFADLIDLAKEHAIKMVIWGNKEKVGVYHTVTKVATMTLSASDRQIGWVTLLFPPENE